MIVPLKLDMNFLFDNCVIILAICHFDKLLESQWVLTQPLLSFMTSLFLYYFRNKWILKTKTKDLQKACLFSNLFCFLDDLWAVNNHLKFDRNYKDSYSLELKLKIEKISTSKASYQITFHKYSQFWGYGESKKSFW